MKSRLVPVAVWILSLAGAFALGFGIRKGGAPAPAAAPDAATGRTAAAEPSPGGSLLAAKPTDAGGSPGAARGGDSPADERRPALEGDALKAEIADVLRINDPVERDRKFLQLLESLTPENAQAFVEGLRESGGGRFGRFGPGGGGARDKLALAFNAWARIDGPAAMEFAMNQEEGDRRGPGGRGGFGGRGGNEDAMAALSGWASADPEAAESWFAEQRAGEGAEEGDEGPGRGRGGPDRMLTFALIDGLVGNDPERAMQYIASLPADDEGRGRYTAIVAGEMLEQGVDAAARWVDSISDPELKTGAVMRVAGSYAEADPAAAAAWVSAQDNAMATRMVASAWASDDLDATVAWAESLEGETQASAFAAAFDRWADDDPESASRYLASMAASPAKDAAVREFAGELSREDPASAIEWAATIGDERSREETVVRVAQQWVRQDAEAAGAWLANSNLSAEALTRVAEQPDRGGFGGAFGGRGRGR